MFTVGVLYLLFEKSILVDSEHSKNALSSHSVDIVSRMILGGQVRDLMTWFGRTC
jgi:phosphatidylinositol glycan class N